MRSRPSFSLPPDRRLALSALASTLYDQHPRALDATDLESSDLHWRERDGVIVHRRAVGG
jgi:hypothetical protein